MTGINQEVGTHGSEKSWTYEVWHGLAAAMRKGRSVHGFLVVSALSRERQGCFALLQQ
jgi:hypothetical protein